MPNTPKKRLLLKLNPKTAAEIQNLSLATHSTIQEVIDMLLYIGKKAIGREVRITSQEETNEVNISLKKFPKIAPLVNKKQENGAA